MKKKRSWISIDKKPTAIRLTKAIRGYLKELGAIQSESNLSATIRRLIYETPSYMAWVEKAKNAKL